MFKSEEDKKIEELARQYSKKDKRLSWETCMKKAKAAQRRFGAQSRCTN